MQVHLGKTLDVELVEQQLADLWKQKSAADEAREDAVLRARVANLLVFATEETLVTEVCEMLEQLTASHPSRVLTMLSQPQLPDQDIEMWIESLCQTDKRGGSKRLSCEQISLRAQGKFVSELPSAALPLLVADLSTFLWWRDRLNVGDRVFQILRKAADRLVIDSAEIEDAEKLLEIHRLFSQKDHGELAVSDLNWARLTYWRELLADFFDVATHRACLDHIDRVDIDYIPADAGQSITSQALLIAGWLASRLGWSIKTVRTENSTTSLTLSCETNSDSEILMRLSPVAHEGWKLGRLARVELHSTADGASWRVERADNNQHLIAEATIGNDRQRGRVLPVRNRTTGQLMSREMEILCNDQIYEEAIAVVAEIVKKFQIPDSK